MHFRIITFLGDPARLDDGVAYTRTQAQPEVDAMKGSHGLSMWVERESGRSAVTTGWADRAALDGSEATLSTGVRAQAGKHLGGDPSSEVFELAVLHQAGPGRPGNWTRTSRFAVPRQAIDAAVAYFEQSALPAIRDYDGLVSVVMLVDRERGRTLTAVTLADDASLAASRERGQELRDGFAAAVPTGSLVEVTEMELVIAGLRPPDGD